MQRVVCLHKRENNDIVCSPYYWCSLKVARITLIPKTSSRNWRQKLMGLRDFLSRSALSFSPFTACKSGLHRRMEGGKFERWHLVFPPRIVIFFSIPLSLSLTLFPRSIMKWVMGYNSGRHTSAWGFHLSRMFLHKLKKCLPVMLTPY